MQEQRSKVAFAEHLHGSIRWPYERSTQRPEPERQPPRMKQRRVAYGGPFRSAKMMRDVWCDSPLERDFYRELDRLPEVLYYQEQPSRISYRFRGRSETYYPDVLVTFTDGRSTLVEIKPMNKVFPFIDWLKWEAMIETSERSGYGFFIGDTGSSLSSLLTVYSDASFVMKIRASVADGPIAWNELKALRSEGGRTNRELSAAVLQAGVVIEESPCTARAATPEETKIITGVSSWFYPQPHDRVQPGKQPETQRPANAFKRWSPQEEEILLHGFNAKATIAELAKQLGRHPGGIRRRLEKLGQL